jgi:hypothetical protein
MKKVPVALLILLSTYSFAQSPVAARLNSGFDVGMAYSKNNYNPSVAYYQLINVGERKLFAFGWTVRLGAFYGDNINYYTAPARLTRGKSGFGGLTDPIIRANIDTIRYDYVTMTSLNAGIRAQINLGRLELGASVDLLGLTLGRRRTGRYRSSTGRFVLKNRANVDTTLFFQGTNVLQGTRPSRVNTRLLGDNDRGTLSTELYARVRINQRVGVKVGYQWQTTETTADNRDVVADNNRFRNRVGMAYVAITLPIFY